jgi:hypothetical protein
MGTIVMFLCPDFHYPAQLWQEVAKRPDLEAELDWKGRKKSKFVLLLLYNSWLLEFLGRINDRC